MIFQIFRKIIKLVIKFFRKQVFLFLFTYNKDYDKKFPLFKKCSYYHRYHHLSFKDILKLLLFG